MTTFYVYVKGHCRLTTHDQQVADRYAAAVPGSRIVPVVRQPTAGELLAGERRVAA